MRLESYGTGIAAAAAIYALAAVWLFWHAGLLTGRDYFGAGTDPFLYIWMFKFLPAAIAQGQNPLLLKLAWAPYGLNITQATTTPLLAVLAWPLTAWVGPVVAYNLVMVMAPAFAAVAAFMLVRELTGRFGAALAGGWVFGFSTAVFAPMTGHLQTAFVAFVPFGFLVALLRARGKISFRFYIGALSLVGVCQFLTSLETYVTMAMFLLIFAALMSQRRDLLAGLAGSVGVTALVMAPFIYYFFKDYAAIPRLMQDGGEYVTDLLNLAVPTRLSWFGGDAFAAVSARFLGNPGEQMGYAGLPLLAVVVGAAWRCLGLALARPVMICFGLALVFTLGPMLHVAGRAVMPMPWALAASLPLLDNVLPARLMVFVFLFAAMLCGLWLGGLDRFYAPACLGVLACAALMLPASRAGSCADCWASPVPFSALFENTTYKTLISRNENVLFLPFTHSRNQALYWQVAGGGYFRTVNGYGDFMPPLMAAWPAVAVLQTGKPAAPPFAAQFDEFVAGTDVSVIVVPADMVGAWDGFLKADSWERADVSGMAVYRKAPRRP